MAPPITFQLDSVYDEGCVALALDLPLVTLAHARRDGALKFVRRGRRVFILGRHILAWLDPESRGRPAMSRQRPAVSKP